MYEVRFSDHNIVTFIFIFTVPKCPGDQYFTCLPNNFATCDDPEVIRNDDGSCTFGCGCPVMTPIWDAQQEKCVETARQCTGQ
jgi:hypothetical protein